MSNVAFDYLTGCVRLDVPRPAELAASLSPFYEAPNHAIWGAAICRTLYHESVHFWQLLASAYLANMVAAEWKRVETFRDTGDVPAPSELTIGFRQRADGAPFSAYQLCECWARYWDVHTRNPNTIIEEEGIAVDIVPNPLGYDGTSYDVLMRTGVESSQYEAPYRWMLEQVARAPWTARFGDGPRVASYVVALVFPVVVHSAFGSPDPVGVTCAVLERLVAREDLATQLLEHKTGSINFDWLNSWAFCRGELVEPVLREKRLPSFTSGLDAIARGHLRRHPFLPAYLSRGQDLLTMLRMQFDARAEIAATAENPYDLRYRTAIVAAPARDPWIVFGLPGQPNYRYMLGQHMPPPRVAFSDAVSLADETALSKLAELSGKPFNPVELGAIPEAAIDELEALLGRFRAASYAVSRGLPATAFKPG